MLHTCLGSTVFLDRRGGEFATGACIAVQHLQAGDADKARSVTHVLDSSLAHYDTFGFVSLVEGPSHPRVSAIQRITLTDSGQITRNTTV
mgnify:CR=1 FL=1